MDLAAGRAAFFGAGPAWLFYLMATLGLALFAWGLAARIQNYPKRPLPSDGFLDRWPLLAPLWRTSSLCGLLTVIAWWTLLDLTLGGPLWLAHMYAYPFLRGLPYLVFSRYLDLAGALFTMACFLLLAGRTGPGGRRWACGWPSFGWAAVRIGPCYFGGGVTQS